MACKGKCDLTIGVAVGSSIQIAAGMIPLLVIIAWAMQKDLTLFFVSTLSLGRRILWREGLRPSLSDWHQSKVPGSTFPLFHSEKHS